jgi:hypothetical protein
LNWSYAHLSHLAKLAGGPEVFISSIQKTAELKGVVKGIIIAVPGTLFFVAGRKKISSLRKSDGNNREQLLTESGSGKSEGKLTDCEIDDTID